MKFHSIDGRFYRIVFAAQKNQVLNGVRSPFGRYHHDGQRAFYASPTRDWAAMAVDAYLKGDDPARATVPLCIRSDKIIDLRNPDHCTALGVSEALANIPWANQHERGERATCWQVSDTVRDFGADGMIYTARSYPGRWHVVLFNWNTSGETSVTVDGPVIPFEWR